MSIPGSSSVSSGEGIRQAWIPSFSSVGAFGREEEINPDTSADARPYEDEINPDTSADARLSIEDKTQLSGTSLKEPPNTPNTTHPDAHKKKEAPPQKRKAPDPMTVALEKCNGEKMATEKISVTPTGALMVEQEGSAPSSAATTPPSKIAGNEGEMKTASADDQKKKEQAVQRLEAKYNRIREELDECGKKSNEAYRAYLQVDAEVGNLENERWGCTDDNQKNQLDRRIDELKRVREEKKREQERLEEEYRRLQEEAKKTREELWRLNMYGEFPVEAEPPLSALQTAPSSHTLSA